MLSAIVSGAMQIAEGLDNELQPPAAGVGARLRVQSVIG